MNALESLGMPVTIWTTPSEVPDRIPFEQDRKHSSYDPDLHENKVLQRKLKGYLLLKVYVSQQEEKNFCWQNICTLVLFSTSDFLIISIEKYTGE